VLWWGKNSPAGPKFVSVQARRCVHHRETAAEQLWRTARGRGGGGASCLTGQPTGPSRGSRSPNSCRSEAGGCGRAAQALDDVWALDTAAKPYQWMHIKPEGETPVARMYATACARADGLLLLCGGRESSNAPMVRELLSLSHPHCPFPSPATLLRVKMHSATP
jgi:hypothetical protein